MLCNLCMKDVDWLIPVKEHKREHPMTYIQTREVCLNCLRKLAKIEPKSEEKPIKKPEKEEKDDGRSDMG